MANVFWFEMNQSSFQTVFTADDRTGIMGSAHIATVARFIQSSTQKMARRAQLQVDLRTAQGNIYNVKGTIMLRVLLC